MNVFVVMLENTRFYEVTGVTAMFYKEKRQREGTETKLFFNVFILAQVVQDWKFVAQVLDRMFLWAFLLVSILGSALLFIPVIYKWASIIVPDHAGSFL